MKNLLKSLRFWKWKKRPSKPKNPLQSMHDWNPVMSHVIEVESDRKCCIGDRLALAKAMFLVAREHRENFLGGIPKTPVGYVVVIELIRNPFDHQEFSLAPIEEYVKAKGYRMATLIEFLALAESFPTPPERCRVLTTWGKGGAVIWPQFLNNSEGENVFIYDCFSTFNVGYKTMLAVVKES